jgi:hypothetical protein
MARPLFQISHPIFAAIRGRFMVPYRFKSGGGGGALK